MGDRRREPGPAPPCLDLAPPLGHSQSHRKCATAKGPSPFQLPSHLRPSRDSECRCGDGGSPQLRARPGLHGRRQAARSLWKSVSEGRGRGPTPRTSREPPGPPPVGGRPGRGADARPTDRERARGSIRSRCNTVAATGEESLPGRGGKWQVSCSGFQIPLHARETARAPTGCQSSLGTQTLPDQQPPRAGLRIKDTGTHSGPCDEPAEPEV